jgi:hypothetical protein
VRMRTYDLMNSDTKKKRCSRETSQTCWMQQSSETDYV